MMINGLVQIHDVRQWESYSQASMLSDLLDRGLSIEEVAIVMRTSVRTTYALIAAYKLHSHAHKVFGVCDVKWFPHFLRLVEKPSLPI